MDIENPMIDSQNLFLNDYITRKKQLLVNCRLLSSDFIHDSGVFKGTRVKRSHYVLCTICKCYGIKGIGVIKIIEFINVIVHMHWGKLIYVNTIDFKLINYISVYVIYQFTDVFLRLIIFKFMINLVFFQGPSI